jgi:hypothetical protein
LGFSTSSTILRVISGSVAMWLISRIASATTLSLVAVELMRSLPWSVREASAITSGHLRAGKKTHDRDIDSTEGESNRMGP